MWVSSSKHTHIEKKGKLLEWLMGHNVVDKGIGIEVHLVLGEFSLWSK